MRTPAVHFWGLNSWTFWKTEPNLDFLITEKSHARPFKKRPQQAIILSGYFKEKVWAPHLYCVRSEAWNVDTSRPRPVGLSLGRTPGGFCHWGDMAVVLQSFSQHLRREIVDRNNNCAVACTHTVEVLKRLIRGTTEGQGRTTVNSGHDVIRAW